MENNKNLDKNKQFNNGYYKLGDVVLIFDSLRKPISSLNRDSNSKTYPYYGANGIIDYIDKYIFEGQYILLGEDGTVIDQNNNPYVYLTNENDKFWVGNHAHVIKPNDDIVLIKYLFYCLSKSNVKHIVTGAVQLKINQDNLKKLNVYIPLLSTQQRIIDIIEPHEKLFLTYSKCVRIDNLEHVKSDIKNLIDIIEPVEKLINTCDKIKNKTFQLFKKLVQLENNNDNKDKIRNLIKVDNLKFLNVIHKENKIAISNMIKHFGGISEWSNKATCKKPFSKHSILIGSIDPDVYEYCYCSPTDGLTNGAVFTILPDEDKINPYYLFFKIINLWNHICIIKPTDRCGQQIDKEYLINYPISFCDLKIQNELVDNYGKTLFIQTIRSKLLLIKSSLINLLVK